MRQQNLEFQRDGFLNLGKLFTDMEVQAIRNAFEEILSNPTGGVEVIRESDSTAVRSVMGWEKAGGVLDAFVRDERVLVPIQSILGDKLVIHQTKYNPKAPRGKGERWDPHRGFTFWHFLDGVPNAEGMISVFIALTDQTIENGAVQTWRGAHHLTLEELQDETDFGNRNEDSLEADTAAYLSLQIKPERIAEYDKRFERVYWTGPAGNIWLVHSCNLHSSPPNLSQNVRELIANVYRTTENYPLHPRSKEVLCGTSKEPLVPYRGKWLTV